MSKVARIGDSCSGTCTAHPVPIPMTGVIQSGSSDVNCEGIQVARLGDVVIGDCGHTGTIVSSSSTVKANGVGVARLGDSFSGDFSGTIVGSNSTVDAN